MAMATWLTDPETYTEVSGTNGCECGSDKCSGDYDGTGSPATTDGTADADACKGVCSGLPAWGMDGATSLPTGASFASGGTEGT